MEGLFPCHCLVLRPEYRGREAALKHPLVRPRTQGPIHSPSQPRTQREARAGRGGAWTRAGASSRWQQRAAAPPAQPPGEPASWMSSSPISLCSPWNSRPQTSTRIHELVSGARAGASGSRRWPRGGSRGGSLLVDAGRGRAAPRSPAPSALPPPCLPVVHTPLGSRAAGLQ